MLTLLVVRATDGQGNIVEITGINGIWDRYITWDGTSKAGASSFVSRLWYAPPIPDPSCSESFQGTSLKFTVVDSDLFLAETAPVTVQDSGTSQLSVRRGTVNADLCGTLDRNGCLD